MLYTIRSGCMQAQISSLGAQLMHLTGKTEYLWQGDPAYWTDRAPTIFPYVARLTNGTYRYEGQTYHLPIHGFAPTAEFTAAQKTADAVVNGLAKLAAQCDNLIVVSNEVFRGGADYAGDTDRYLLALAQINNATATRADAVVRVVCGIPRYYKGG